MTTKPNLLIGLLAISAAAPACSEVIEVDPSGAYRRFDGPAVFTVDAVTPIAHQSAAAASASDIDRAIAEASRDHGVDRDLLKAVAWQESRGRMSAISPRGAAGVMQLMPATAAELGVRPGDLRENIHGGAIYLRRQIDRFGNIPMALAAYNAGPGAVTRYSGIPPFRETQDYVMRIMSRWKPLSVVKPLLPAPVRVTNPSFIEVPN